MFVKQNLYVKKEMFDELKNLFDEAMDAEQEANELLIATWKGLKRTDRNVLRDRLEKHFREVGMYIDGKVFT